MTEPRPRIAMTLGDVAGIGPEVVVRAVDDDRVSSARFVPPLSSIGQCRGRVSSAMKLAGIDVSESGSRSIPWRKSTGRHRRSPAGIPVYCDDAGERSGVVGSMRGPDASGVRLSCGSHASRVAR